MILPRPNQVDYLGWAELQLTRLGRHTPDPGGPVVSTRLGQSPFTRVGRLPVTWLGQILAPGWAGSLLPGWAGIASAGFDRSQRSLPCRMSPRPDRSLAPLPSSLRPASLLCRVYDTKAKTRVPDARVTRARLLQRSLGSFTRRHPEQAPSTCAVASYYSPADSQRTKASYRQPTPGVATVHPVTRRQRDKTPVVMSSIMYLE